MNIRLLNEDEKTIYEPIEDYASEKILAVLGELNTMFVENDVKNPLDKDYFSAFIDNIAYNHGELCDVRVIDEVKYKQISEEMLNLATDIDSKYQLNNLYETIIKLYLNNVDYWRIKPFEGLIGNDKEALWRDKNIAINLFTWLDNPSLRTDLNTEKIVKNVFRIEM